MIFIPVSNFGDQSLESIWYHLKPLEVPYSPNHFLGWDFFCRFLQQTTTVSRIHNHKHALHSFSKVEKLCKTSNDYHNQMQRKVNFVKTESERVAQVDAFDSHDFIKKYYRLMYVIYYNFATTTFIHKRFPQQTVHTQQSSIRSESRVCARLQIHKKISFKALLLFITLRLEKK